MQKMAAASLADLVRIAEKTADTHHPLTPSEGNT